MNHVGEYVPEYKVSLFNDEFILLAKKNLSCFKELSQNVL